MMISHGRRPGAPILFTSAALILLPNAGCSLNSGSGFTLRAGARFASDAESRVTLVWYKDPFFPETSEVSFSECTYETDASGDLQVTARGEWAVPRTAGPLERILHLHVYWQPHPGVTFSNSSTTTATIRYVVATQDGTACYTGTGFAYPVWRRGDLLEMDIESANLQLDASTGDTPEVLGAARLTGKLFARRDPFRTVDLMRQSELRAAGALLP